MKKTLIPEYLDRIDGKIALRNGFGATIAWYVGGEFSELLPHPNPTVSSLWCVITAILVLQAHLGGTYWAAWMRFLGLIVGSVIGGIVATVFGSDPITLGLAVSFTIAACSVLKLKESFRIAIATVTVIMVLLPLNPDVPPFMFAFYRFLDSCLGILIAVAVAHTIWPYHAREKMRVSMGNAVQDIGRLYRMITLSDESGDNQKNLIKDIDQKLYQNRQMLEDSKPELITKSARVNDWSLLIAQLDELFELVLSMRHVYRPDTKKIFDSDLNHHLEDVVEEISITFHAVASMLETGKWNSSLPDLGLSLTHLKEELVHFRGKKRTREFSLEEVESFFVFFYSLKSIMEVFKRIENTIHSLITEESF